MELEKRKKLKIHSGIEWIFLYIINLFFRLFSPGIAGIGISGIPIVSGIVSVNLGSFGFAERSGIVGITVYFYNGSGLTVVIDPLGIICGKTDTSV